MVIRCERCSTLYELDEALLSPTGSQVQCTRCQHVFTAHPPRAAGRTLVGMPAAEQPEPPPPAPRRAAESGVRHTPRGPAQAAGGNGSAGAQVVAGPRPEPPRAVRTGPPPVYRPAAPAAVSAPTSGRPPLLRRDTVGTFEARLRWHARWKWLAPLLVVIVVAGGAAGWFLLSRRSGDPAAARAHAEAVALFARDDDASVEQGVSRLDEVLRRSPKQGGAAADRALAQVLRAAAISEDRDGLAARMGEQEAVRERLRREQPAGWEEAERAAAAEVQRLDLEKRSREERARALGAAAIETLRRLQAEQGDAPEVARGLAMYFAMSGERDRARTTVREARARAPADPWLDLAEAWADAGDPERAARERALVELGTLATAHPELLRARLLLARTQADLGRRPEALATVEALVAANAKHEAGRRLRDALTAPAPEPAPPPAPEPPPPEKPLTQPRKRISQPPVPLAPLPGDGAPPSTDEPASTSPDAGLEGAPGAEPAAPAQGDTRPVPTPAAAPAGMEGFAPPPARPARRIERVVEPAGNGG